MPPRSCGTRSSLLCLLMAVYWVLCCELLLASAISTYDVYIDAGWTIEPSQINNIGDANTGPVVSVAFGSVVPSNVTWNAYQTAANLGLTFGMSLTGYDDPLGLTTLVNTAPLSIRRVVLSGNDRILNITFTPTQCYLPKQLNVLYIIFGTNATNMPGSRIRQVVNPNDASRIAAGDLTSDVAIVSSVADAIAVRMTAVIDSTSAADGLIVVGLICGCCAITFFLGNWFDALFTLMQLQLLVIMCFTPCAPVSAAAIFNKAVWVLWPLSTHSSDVTNPEDQGRMLFNFIFIGIMLFVQGCAVVLFAYFSSSSRRRHSTGQRTSGTIDPRSRVKFPQGTLFVAGFLFQGSAMSCVKTFALHYLGFLGSNVAGPLALSIFTVMFLIVQLIAMWVVVFKLVSQQVFLEPLTKSFFVFAFLGGNWANADVRKQWGVLFDGVNGSSFWFFASTFTLCAVNSMLAGFVPGSLDSCTTVYYLMLVVQAVQLILVFVRRPFKSVAQNALNICVTILHTVVCIAFVSAMECSRMQSRFSSFSVWFTLVALFLKSVMSAGLQVVIRAHRAMRGPLTIPLEARGEVSPERHNTFASRRRAIKNLAQLDEDLAMQLLQDVEAEQEERAVLYPLDSAADDNSVQRVAAMWKPLLPQPTLLGSNVVSREVGFGGPGGLTAAEGPSVALKLAQPSGLCCDADTLYLLDSGNNRILSHKFSERRCETVCGGQFISGYAGDLAADPSSVAMDGPRFITLGHRVAYFSDTGNDCVRRVDLASGQTVTIVGGNNASSTAALLRPMGLQAHGQFLYIANSGGHCVLLYDFQENIITTVCGTGYPGYDGDGVFAAASRLNNPQGLCIRPHDGALFIADTGNHRVVRVDPSTRRLSTVLGTPGRGGESLVGSNGSDSIQATVAQLCLPTDVACGPEDSLLVVDGGNGKVWIVNHYGFARILLPASDDVIPRHICVPKSMVNSCMSSSSAQQSSFAAHNPAASTARAVRSGMALSTALLQSSSDHTAVLRQRGPTSPHFTFYVSDSVHNMVVSVDASSSRSTSFSVEALYNMAHPESAIRIEDVSGGRAAAQKTEVAMYTQKLLVGDHRAGMRGASGNNSASSGNASFSSDLHNNGEDGGGSTVSPIRKVDDKSAYSPIKFGDPSSSALFSPPTALRAVPLYERPITGRYGGGPARELPRSSSAKSRSTSQPSPPHEQAASDTHKKNSGPPRDLSTIPRRLQIDAPDEADVSSASSDESWL